MEVTSGPCITSYVAGSACAVSNIVVLSLLGTVSLEEEFETEGGCGTH